MGLNGRALVAIRQIANLRYGGHAARVMTKRRRWLLLLAGVGVTVAAALWLCLRHPGEGPVYKGRQLSDWVTIRGHWGRDSGSLEELFESKRAIEASGTNAFPFLLKWIQHEDKDYSGGLLRPVRWLIPERRFHDLTTSRREPLARGAGEAFIILSNNITPEVALELERLLNNANAPQTAWRVARVFVNLGGRGEKALVATLQQPGHPAAVWAVTLLWEQHSRVGLRLPTNSMVPGLIQFATLTNGFATVQTSMAISLLSDLGVPSNQYVPALTNLLADPEPDVRLAATNALRQIAPQVLGHGPGS